MSSFIIHKCGGITLVWAHCSQLRKKQIHIKADRIKMKLYLHQNHTIGYVFVFVDRFNSQDKHNSFQRHTFNLDLFCLGDNGP